MHRGAAFAYGSHLATYGVLPVCIMATRLPSGSWLKGGISGPDALKVAKKTDGKIDLLLSGVDMPQMSGPDLGERLKKTRLDLHVMLMSGGANGNLLVLNYGWAFIQKPFVAVKLVQMVTDVLHSRDRSQLGGQEFDSRKDTR